MTNPQASAGSGTRLNSKIGKGRSRSEASQVMEAPQTHPIDEQGLICIRRLDKRIGADPHQRRADQDFLNKHFGFAEVEISSMFRASDGHVRASLKRRREERGK